MTNQHPLTDEFLQHIEEDLTRHDAWGRHILPSDFELMRTAADWQLEQVLEWLKVNLMKHDFYEGYAYLYDDCSDAYIKEEELLEGLKKAMRPTQENNS